MNTRALGNCVSLQLSVLQYSRNPSSIDLHCAEAIVVRRRKEDICTVFAFLCSSTISQAQVAYSVPSAGLCLRVRTIILERNGV